MPGCESCGADAEVLLDDGSMWCIGCDLRARSLGYDNREAVFVPTPLAQETPEETKTA